MRISLKIVALLSIASTASAELFIRKRKLNILRIALYQKLQAWTATRLLGIASAANGGIRVLNIF